MNFDFFKNRNKKERQEWNPHWSLKLLYGIWTTAATVLKIALGAAATVLLICLVCGFVFVGILGDYLQSDILPNATENLDGYDLEQTSFVYYVDGDGDIQELQQIYTVTDRRWATIDEIPEDLIHAAIAIEDKRFYEHQGVDWITTVKACANLFMGDSSKFGGSTITQQLIKNLTGDDGVTVQRKVTEIFKALQFESQYDKDLIMEWYLNTIYFGYGKYGVRSAAEKYFGKELEMLTTAECAALISITNNPSMFNPFSDNEYTYQDQLTLGKDRNRIRQVNTLYEMRNQGYLTEEAYQEALAQEMVFKSGIADEDRLVDCGSESCDYSGIVKTFTTEDGQYICPECGTVTDIDSSASQEVYSWFVEAVIDDVCSDLAALDGVDWTTADDITKSTYQERLKKGGYHIYSTLDMDIQQEVDKIYTNLDEIPTTRSTQQLESGIVIIDNRTGDIVALCGAVGEKVEFDALSYATEAQLQTGSTMKPVAVYAPAFELGVVSPATVISDMPLYYNGGTPFPRNDNRKYSFSRTVYSGIVSSVNGISVNTLHELGLEESYDFAKEKFRLHGLVESYTNSSGTELTDLGYSPLGMGALTLGVTVRDMSAAYATFANDGQYREARTYTKVYDSQGNLVLDNTQEVEQILSEKTVNYINYCLTAAVNGGTGTAAKVKGQTVAGKTGTTSSNCDRWFCGYTAHYTAAVWCGYRYPEPIKLTGNTSNPACRLFKKVMTPIHQGLENTKLYSTSNFRAYSVCLDSGKLATEACGLDVREEIAGLNRVASAYAYRGDAASSYCTQHVLVDYCVTGGGVATDYCSKFPDVTIGERALLKLNSDQIAEIKKANTKGLPDSFVSDGYVYYVTGAGKDQAWHGFDGKANKNSSAPYIVCPTHTKAAWEEYQASQATEPPTEETEGGLFG